MLASQQLAAKDHEIDQLRKELSTLRVEKSDDQRTINELHKRLENTLQEHQRVVEKLNQAHRY
jgi:chromosome segregation ATPase